MAFQNDVLWNGVNLAKRVYNSCYWIALGISHGLLSVAGPIIVLQWLTPYPFNFTKVDFLLQGFVAYTLLLSIADEKYLNVDIHTLQSQKPSASLFYRVNRNFPANSSWIFDYRSPVRAAQDCSIKTCQELIECDLQSWFDGCIELRKDVWLNCWQNGKERI